MNLPILISALAVVCLVFYLRPLRTTVFEYERGVKFSRGRFKGVLRPGMYWHSAQTRIHRLDVRSTRVAIAGQEVLSADGVAVKASILATYRVSDAEKAFLGSDSLLVAPLTIGSRARTGAGAVVTRDVPADATVVGVPARPFPARPSAAPESPATKDGE